MTKLRIVGQPTTPSSKAPGGKGTFASDGVWPDFNGVSINKIELEQNGDMHVTFDLPTPAHTNRYRIDVQGKRSFDLYDDPELKDAAQELFAVLRRRMALPDPSREGIDCMKCTESSCCREYDVFVTDFDIERLAKHLQLSVDEVTEKYLTPLADWSGDFKYHLGQDEDEQGGKCHFLKRQPDGAMRCSAYEGRPELCRTFDAADCTLFDGNEET